MKYATDKELIRILEKSARIQDSNIDDALTEMSLSKILTEAIDQADIDKVSSAIDEAADWLQSVLTYFDTIGDFDTNKIPVTMVYIESLIDALKEARGQLSSASFESGAVSSFLGQKLTLPQIAQGAIAVQTKAQDFGVGFSAAVENIAKNLAPLVTEEDREKPLRDLAGQEGIPDETKLSKGIKSAITKAFGGGFFNKVKAFFKNPTGAEKKILQKIPDLDVSAMADEVVEAFLDSPMKSFLTTDLKPPDKEEGLGAVAQESQEQEQEEAEEVPTEEAPPAQTEEEAQESQDQAQEELRSAVESEVQDPQSPADAALGAIDTWANSLSKTSQSSLKTKNRLSSLKDIVKVGLDDATSAVEGEVEAAIQSWRDENEETLLKSKRFAKKNFDSLQNLIPKLAAAMLKKSNESARGLSKHTVSKTVHKFLDKKFYSNSDNVLSESKYSEKEMLVYRLNKLAGLQ